MTRLSVNLNKVALLRNSRHLGIPSVTGMAAIALAAGAKGITVHPRPDQRHIRPDDVADLAALLREWPDVEFNIEGNPFDNLMEYARRYRPHQCTLVPDAPDTFTSDHGWSFPADTDRLSPVVHELKSLGIRVSLFMDPDSSQMSGAAATGADRIELYTEAYAKAYGTADEQSVLNRYTDAAGAATAAGLGVNAGHDLSQVNLGRLLMAIPGIEEVSIGHALTAEALENGMAATVRSYIRITGRLT
jgi:pyridoxine 5-phosphate synthase